MKYQNSVLTLILLAVISAGAGWVWTPTADVQKRPRRVKPAPSAQPTPGKPLGAEAKSVTAASNNAPLLDVNPARPGGTAPASTDTMHAYQLFKQKQYAEAAKEAKAIATSDPGNAEAWKLAGFSEFYLKQYDEASEDLQKALDLQRKANQEDSHTVDALAESYTLAEKYDRALPLLVAVTTRAGSQPDAMFLYYRGLSEYKTGKTAEAEKSFNEAIKANPKHTPSLVYLGQMALARK